VCLNKLILIDSPRITVMVVAEESVSLRKAVIPALIYALAKLINAVEHSPTVPSSFA